MALAREARRPPRKIAEAWWPTSEDGGRRADRDRGPGLPERVPLAALVRGRPPPGAGGGRGVRPVRRGQGHRCPPRVRLGQSDRAARDRQRARGRGGRRARAHLPGPGLSRRIAVLRQRRGQPVHGAGALGGRAAAAGAGRDGRAARERVPGRVPDRAGRGVAGPGPAGHARARCATGSGADRASRAPRGRLAGGEPAARARGLRHPLRPLGPRAARRARRGPAPGGHRRAHRAGHTYERTARSGSGRPRLATTRTGCCGSRTAS